MTRPAENFWEDLFRPAAQAGQGQRVEMRLLRKNGRPFLLLPRQPRLAAATLGLYPAQTTRARAARAVFRLLLRASIAPGAEDVSLTIAASDPFARFLWEQAGTTGTGVPPMGILAGNPMSAGQRLLVMVFDPQQQPVAVVKVGRTEQANALVEKEATFLVALPVGTSGAPRLRATFQSPALRALALDFIAGNSPTPGQGSSLPPLLESWLDLKRKIQLSEAADWQRLSKAVTAGPEATLIRSLGRRTVLATITHGDLTPWNVKVSSTGAWTVLDWERGELAGIPGWDWFHYVLQRAILVERLPVANLAQRVDALLASDPFKRYAELAGIAGFERDLVQAYLLHMLEVVKPSEGLPATRELFQCRRSAGRT